MSPDRPPSPDPAIDAERARLFGLLGRLLGGPPDAAMLASLARLPSGATPIGSAVGALALAAAGTTPTLVEREYFALFIGVGRGELLPYASYYRTGFLHERPLADLRGDLALLGIVRVAGTADPEDHVAFLCDAMAGLLDGRFAGDPDRFFAKHLQPWCGRCFADLEAAGAARFYRTVGRLGCLVTELEHAAAALTA